MVRVSKVRLDQLLVERGISESRSRAAALILAGKVMVDQSRVDKPGSRVPKQASIRIKQPDHPYVSRGGVKLAGALRAFSLEVSGCTVLDVGASTGGFTDCLLAHGAERVYALDVGRGQLHQKLRADPRVVSIQGVNVRKLKPGDLPEPVDLLVVDVSFISLRLALPPALACLKPGGKIVALVKPQFEVGRERVGKGGVVRDEALREQAVDGIVEIARALGLEVRGRAPSCLLGADGNQEYFLLLSAK